MTPEANLGLATGAGSAVVVLDVDARHGGNESLAALEDAYSPLPTTVETATGGGGRHLYFNHPGGSVSNSVGKIGNGLDIRGDGGHVVLPPSVHPSGAMYEWIKCPEQSPLADLPEWLLKRIEGKENEDELGIDIPTPVIVSSMSSCVLSVTPEVEALIASTQPTAEGQRHALLFNLARGLKSIDEFADADASQCEAVVRQWHGLAKSIIATKPWEDTWGDFIESWPKVKYPAGTGPLAEAVDRAEHGTTPPEAERYDSESTRLLAAVCRELQRTHGADPFFLAVRKAGEIVGVDRNAANRLMNMFLADGLLKLAAENTTRKARQYRYCGVMA